MVSIERARLEAARRLLEDGDLQLQTVGGRVGLSKERSLRKSFVWHLGVAPHEYRSRFGGAMQWRALPEPGVRLSAFASDLPPAGRG